MSRRLAIRVALWCGLIISLIEWPTSYWLTPWIDYQGTRHTWNITSRDGSLVAEARVLPAPLAANGFSFHLFLENNHPPLSLETLFPLIHFWHGPAAGALRLPWWMLALVFALPLAWIWRLDKQAARNSTRAFPIDPGATG